MSRKTKAPQNAPVELVGQRVKVVKAHRPEELGKVGEVVAVHGVYASVTFRSAKTGLVVREHAYRPDQLEVILPTTQRVYEGAVMTPTGDLYTKFRIAATEATLAMREMRDRLPEEAKHYYIAITLA